jgi:hypothetical protein
MPSQQKACKAKANANEIENESTRDAEKRPELLLCY